MRTNMNKNEFWLSICKPIYTKIQTINVLLLFHFQTEFQKKSNK